MINTISYFLNLLSILYFRKVICMYVSVYVLYGPIALKFTEL